MFNWAMIWFNVVKFFIKLFTGGYGVVANYVMIGIVIAIVLFGAYWEIRIDTEKRVKLEQEVTMLTSQVAQQTALADYYKKQIDITNQVLSENEQKLSDEVKKNQEILDYISGKGGASDQVPDIIKQFFQELQNAQKKKKLTHKG